MTLTLVHQHFGGSNSFSLTANYAPCHSWVKLISWATAKLISPKPGSPWEGEQELCVGRRTLPWHRGGKGTLESLHRGFGRGRAWQTGQGGVPGGPVTHGEQPESQSRVQTSFCHFVPEHPEKSRTSSVTRGDLTQLAGVLHRALTALCELSIFIQNLSYHYE